MEVGGRVVVRDWKGARGRKRKKADLASSQLESQNPHLLAALRPAASPVKQRERQELREGVEDFAGDFSAFQVAQQDHREFVGLEPTRCQLDDVVVGDGFDSG
jgi:hypothetical protein